MSGPARGLSRLPIFTLVPYPDGPERVRGRLDLQRLLEDRVGSRHFMEKAKHLLASFRKKKNPEMSPTMAQHFQYSRCDPPHERFAVGVPFAFATSCFR